MADTFTKIYKFYASTHISINNTDNTFFGVWFLTGTAYMKLICPALFSVYTHLHVIINFSISFFGKYREFYFQASNIC